MVNISVIKWARNLTYYLKKNSKFPTVICIYKCHNYYCLNYKIVKNLNSAEKLNSNKFITH